MKTVGVLMVGAGEYTVGYVPTAHGAASDKPAGVVALSCFELRRQGLVGRIVLCDMYGSRMPAVRATLQRKIDDVYSGLDTSLECFPEDHVEQEPTAYLRAMATMSPGDVAIIFVPDDLHAAVAEAAARHRLHVLLAKPAVKTLGEHRALLKEVEAAGVLACVEFHKRFDPMYSDARNRARHLGPFSHFSSYMAQPKQQLDTFRAWAGLRSDISYYLNSHHIDMHSWMVGHGSRPERVVAMAATGIAQEKLGRSCEDTITLLVQWRNEDRRDRGGHQDHQPSQPPEGEVGAARASPGAATAPVATAAAAAAAGSATDAAAASLSTVGTVDGNSGGGGGGASSCSCGGDSGGSLGTAVYTASWVTAKGDCHTQQGFRYSGHRGELRVDQAHRGYDGATDDGGFASYNPLYMRYTPDANGRFAGQSGYGFVSIARFVEAAAQLNAGATSLEQLRRQGELAMLVDSLPVTAVLHAGRLSLDTESPVQILYDALCSTAMEEGRVAVGAAPMASALQPQQPQQQHQGHQTVQTESLPLGIQQSGGPQSSYSRSWKDPVGLQVEGAGSAGRYLFP